MKKALQLILSTMLLIGLFLADLAVAQDGPQDVTIRDLNTYENLESYDDIPDHPLEGVPVEFTAVVVSYPKSSGLSGFNDDEEGSIGRIHMFVADTSAKDLGHDGMYIRIVNAFETSAFSDLEDLSRGSVVTFTGNLTFFEETSQFEVSELVELGNVTQSQFSDYEFLLEPVPVDPTEYHTSTGANEVELDLEAYQKYNNMYVDISSGTTSNYNLDDGRVAFSVVKDGVFTGHRDISLRYRNDRSTYRSGYNYRRSEVDGDFELPPIGSSVNVSGFLSVEDLSEGGLSFSNGGGFFISPMEDGILWVDEETRLENGVSLNGDFEWPVDFEVIGSPPQLLSVDFDPVPQDDVYTPGQTVTLSALTAAPEDDPSVTVDSVVVNYTTRSGGEQRFQMEEVGTNEYEFTLPELVAFESPTIFVQAYGSNGLVGRFPTIGSQSFYVDGGTITEIETIQRTGDDGDGPSPLEGLSGLDFDITATVVSEPGDGVIAVQSGTAPWSGIFLELGVQTANLQRGDVVKITGANVEEAEVANNDNTYTYLSGVTLSVTSSDSDISNVVPVLTTDEFNEPVAPGEAWEGMLVTFENVQMISDEGFGEVLFATIDTETEEMHEGTSVINWDTRGGSPIGETGFPQDFNRHVILGSIVDKVSGLVTSTFGITKVIPRELEDIVGENYTIPRPLFNLSSPNEGVEIGVVEESEIVASWQSLNPRDFDSNAVTFEWVLFDTDSTELATLSSDNDGVSAEITIDFETADGLLADLGIDEGESVEVLWSVRASDGENEILKSNFLDGTGAGTSREMGESFFEPSYNSLILTRGEPTSGEEFSDLPRSFDLKQNFPNPFNPTTQINYAVPENAQVKIEVYNVIGRRVATLVDREMAPGNYTVNFDASSLSSGMYFYRLQAGSTLLTKKMTLIK
ncbi:T9SS type A sorting domain-containing protein [Rhodohalobacter sp.]|uniref:T9SS type A sorting domain-containing protein n=1 Tax=Rhodohalobacter sp. TaxID=1974210 RepID=UPI00356B45F3